MDCSTQRSEPLLSIITDKCICICTALCILLPLSFVLQKCNDNWTEVKLWTALPSYQSRCCQIVTDKYILIWTLLVVDKLQELISRNIAIFC